MTEQNLPSVVDAMSSVTVDARPMRPMCDEDENGYFRPSDSDDDSGDEDAESEEDTPSPPPSPPPAQPNMNKQPTKTNRRCYNFSFGLAFGDELGRHGSVAAVEKISKSIRRRYKTLSIAIQHRDLFGAGHTMNAHREESLYHRANWLPDRWKLAKDSHLKFW